MHTALATTQIIHIVNGLQVVLTTARGKDIQGLYDTLETRGQPERLRVFFSGYFVDHVNRYVPIYIQHCHKFWNNVGIWNFDRYGLHDCTE